METLLNFPTLDDAANWIGCVRGFRGIRVLVIGDVMLDRYVEGSAARLCREGPVPIVRREYEEIAPGGAANTAANLAALGATVTLAGLAGDDPAAAALVGKLEQLGVDTSLIVRHPALRTLEKIRVIADGQFVVRIDDGQTVEHAELTAHRLRDNVRSALGGVDLIVISDYDYGVLSRGLLGVLARFRDASGCPIAVDAKHLARYERFRPDLITPNLLEALVNARVEQLPDSRPQLADVERIARALKAQTGARQAAVTLDERGALVIDEAGRALHISAHPVANAFAVGAGDSFIAAYSLALASGAECSLCARLAVLAAGIAVTKRRTAVASHQELLQRVSLWGHGATGLASGSLQALSTRLATAAREGKCIVLTNGVFDILHSGHIAFLRQARELGDVLVVAINTDASVRRLKGPGRPINRQEDRLALVAALDPVDEVILFDEDEPSALIRALAPHIHVKGGDYAGQLLPEAAAIEEVGGRFVFLPLLGDQSTTGVISRIASSVPAEAAR